jgi:hypothetical protein
MALYEFRFTAKDSNGRKARGLVEAKSIRELFWAIDRFGDPYQATYRKRSNIALCYWDGRIENQSDDVYDLAKWKTFTGRL